MEHLEVRMDHTDDLLHMVSFSWTILIFVELLQSVSSGELVVLMKTSGGVWISKIRTYLKNSLRICAVDIRMPLKWIFFWCSFNSLAGYDSNVFFKESGDLNLGERNIRWCNFILFLALADCYILKRLEAVEFSNALYKSFLDEDLIWPEKLYSRTCFQMQKDHSKTIASGQRVSYFSCWSSKVFCWDQRRDFWKGAPVLWRKCRS